MTPTENAVGLDVRGAVRTLWRWKWILLACIVLLPVGAYLLSARNPKVYSSTVLMRINATAVDTTLVENNVPAPQAVDQVASQASARLITTSGVAQAAAKFLNLPPASAHGLLGEVSASADPSTGFITITAQAPSGQRAADVANAFASAVVAGRAASARAQVQRSIRDLEVQLAQVPARNFLERQPLSQQLQRFRALLAAQGNNAQVIEPAAAPVSPISPRPTRAALLGLLVGVLLGLGLVALAENLDRRVRKEEDFEELARRPLLAAIPRTAYEHGDSLPYLADAFQTLRNSLMFFNIDRPISSVLINSPARGDGKTTVAVQLARSLTRSGRDVILVDADLRRPQAGSRLGVTLEPGLSNVLTSSCTLEEALHDVQIEGVSGPLRVLPAGSMPPNPSELLASQRMRDLLVELQEMSDIVVVDTSPVTVISDAIPLLEQASGVVLLGRVNQTAREAFSRLVATVEAARGQTLGVVATGLPESASRYYGYGAYYASNGEGNGSGGASSRRRLSLRS